MANYKFAVAFGTQVIKYDPESVSVIEAANEGDDDIYNFTLHDGTYVSYFASDVKFFDTIEECNAYACEQKNHLDNKRKELATLWDCNPFELQILRLMVEEGNLPEDIVEFHQIVNGVQHCLEWNSSLLDAYLDYMH